LMPYFVFTLVSFARRQYASFSALLAAFFLF